MNVRAHSRAAFTLAAMAGPVPAIPMVKGAVSHHSGITGPKPVAAIIGGVR